MRELAYEEIGAVAGGDSWGGTPEGQAPYEYGNGMDVATMVDDCTAGNLLVCTLDLLKAYTTVVEKTVDRAPPRNTIKNGGK